MIQVTADRARPEHTAESSSEVVVLQPVPARGRSALGRLVLLLVVGGGAAEQVEVGAERRAVGEGARLAPQDLPRERGSSTWRGQGYKHVAGSKLRRGGGGVITCSPWSMRASEKSSSKEKALACILRHGRQRPQQPRRLEPRLR